MADCGVASRRKAEELIAEGRVRVNGDVRSEAPVMIDPEKDIVTIDEQVVEGGKAGAELQAQELVYFLLNKPKGILVTNYDPSDRKTVGELMTGIEQRVFPVGRLDMDSRGALIMTNDGELANRLAHPRHGVEKTYIVEVDGAFSAGDIEKLKRGLWLGPEFAGGAAQRTERFKVKLIGRERGRTLLEVKLAEGKNREIRRVMARLGHPVRDLNRVAIAGKVTLRGLEPGEYRPLTEEEVKWLYYASSKEYHERERAATQAWYEAKEMEKERRRLAKEEAESQRNAQDRRPHAPAKGLGEGKTAGESGRLAKSLRRRPERKGRKPFVPPSGRNAGLMLGGSKKNRQEMAKKLRSAADGQPGEPIKKEIHAIHPLGDQARRDEED